MKTTIGRLYHYFKAPQPAMGLKEYALLRPFAPPQISMFGPVNDGVMRQLRNVGPALTVPTNAVPLSYVLGPGDPYFGTAGASMGLTQAPDPRDM